MKMFFRSLPTANHIFYKLAVVSLVFVAIIISIHFCYNHSPISLTKLDVSLYSNDILRQRQTPRIFCLITTTPKYFLTRAKAVHDTWAPRCDRYFFVTESYENNAASELMDFAKQIPIAPIKNIIPGYDHLTQKSNLALLFAYTNYINDYDWFVKADDDTYLLVDQLKTFLSDKDVSEPVTYGYNYKMVVDNGYHSGGGSYVLSRESLRRFYQAYNESPSNCQKDGDSEDIEIARCLRTKGVYPGNSLDKQNRERFHPLAFEKHFRGTWPHWFVSYAESPPQTKYNCCSDQTISFHYVDPEQQYLMDFLLYRIRSKPSTVQ